MGSNLKSTCKASFNFFYKVGKPRPQTYNGVYFKRRSSSKDVQIKLQIWPLYMWARIKGRRLFLAEQG
jgi:hypothetical protein